VPSRKRRTVKKVTVLRGLCIIIWIFCKPLSLMWIIAALIDIGFPSHGLWLRTGSHPATLKHGVNLHLRRKLQCILGLSCSRYSRGSESCRDFLGSWWGGWLFIKHVDREEAFRAQQKSSYSHEEQSKSLSFGLVEQMKWDWV